MKLSHRLHTFFMLGSLGLVLCTALPARAAETVTDLPRSIGELMKMKPMQVMHMMDPEHKGMVTKEAYLKFFGDLWDKMDKNNAGMVHKEEWMGYSRNK